MVTPVLSRLHVRRWAKLAAVGVFVACVGFPVGYATVVPEHRPALRQLPPPPQTSYQVFVVDWGYHTAVVVEQPAGWRLGPPGDEAAPFLEYAWGDRAFYRDSDHRPGPLVAAVVLPTRSVLYLRGHAGPPRFAGADAVFARTVDGPTLRRLLHDLERTVGRASDGSRQPPRRAPGFEGAFYPAHGAYLWTRNCNWWTVARLASVDLASPPAGVVFTPQVPRRLRGFTSVPLAR